MMRQKIQTKTHNFEAIEVVLIESIANTDTFVRKTHQRQSLGQSFS